VLRGIRYAKRLVNSVSGDPHDPVGIVDNNRHRVAHVSRDLPIDEKVLQLLASAEADRLKSVAGTTISYGQTSVDEVAPDCGDGAVAHGCTGFD
jgi:hypothetical protein